MTKLNQTNMTTTPTPVPFSLDRWNTGKYTAVYRNGNPARIIRTDASGSAPIVSDDGIEPQTHRRNGSFFLNDAEDPLDLFLLQIPEPEVRYVSYGWVNEYAKFPDYAFHKTIDEADKRSTGDRLRCIEVFVREEVK